MTTLHQLISNLDKTLLEQEQLLDSYAGPKPVLGEIEEMRKYVLVESSGHRLAIPINGLAEIGPMPAITPLPNLPLWILGVANQRGEIISVIDLNHLIIPGAPYPKKGAKIAVLYSGNMKVGISIDQVIATVSRPESDRVQLKESALAESEPAVFSSGLEMEGQTYQILKPSQFMEMDRLMRYYLTE